MGIAVAPPSMPARMLASRRPRSLKRRASIATRTGPNGPATRKIQPNICRGFSRIVAVPPVQRTTPSRIRTHSPPESATGIRSDATSRSWYGGDRTPAGRRIPKPGRLPHGHRRCRGAAVRKPGNGQRGNRIKHGKNARTASRSAHPPRRGPPSSDRRRWRLPAGLLRRSAPRRSAHRRRTRHRPGSDTGGFSRRHPQASANGAAPPPDEKAVTGCELESLDNLIRE